MLGTAKLRQFSLIGLC